MKDSLGYLGQDCSALAGRKQSVGISNRPNEVPIALLRALTVFPR